MWSFFEALVLVAMTIGQIWWAVLTRVMYVLSILQVLEEILWSETSCLKAPERMSLLGTICVFGSMWLTGLEKGLVNHSTPIRMSGESLLEETIVSGGDFGWFHKETSMPGLCLYPWQFHCSCDSKLLVCSSEANTFHSILSVTVIKTVNNNIKLIK